MGRALYRRGVPSPHRSAGPPRGIVLAEVVVAATVLTIGVLAALGVLATATRDARRARARLAGVALLAARMERWRAAPCTPASGEQRAGTLVERWSTTRSGSLATLTDTVTLGAPASQRVAVAGVTLASSARCSTP